MRFGIRELIFVVLLLAVPVAAYFFVFEPRNRQITEARAEIAARQAKLRQLEAATKAQPDFAAEITKLSDVIEVFEQKLPDQREVEVMLEKVWQLAVRHNLLPKRTHPEKPLATAHYFEQPIRVQIVGDFEGFYGFLLDLERLSRITRMPDMKLAKATAQKQEEGQMQADFTLSIFFENPAAAPAAAPAADTKGGRL